jgi:hypothetical protein
MAGISSNSPSESSKEANTAAAASVVTPYEELLNRDGEWALSEGSLFFEKKGAVQRALRRIAKRLDELEIPYAIAGAMALFQHGYRRFTEDVDILVTREGLKRIHKALDGLGYIRLFSQSKNLRDTEFGVRIEFLIAGQYPGDGKAKPIAFPDPADAAIEIDGIKALRLETLIELKLASGMTNPQRLKDLADVQEFAKYVSLPPDFAERLHPYVRAKFVELCKGIVPRDIEAEGPEQQP